MAKSSEEVKTYEIFVDGRVINSALYVKDAYNEQSVPKYKIEIAFPKGDGQKEKIEDQLLDFADDRWGEGAGDDEDLVLPFLDGDKLARKREKKEKDGAAYKGMWVIRADTIFNKDGDDGPGGVYVVDEHNDPILAINKKDFYNGCYARVAVNPAGYQNAEENNAVKLYLQGVQKTDDGEPLKSPADRSSLFKPVGRSGGGEKSEGGSRRRRSR